jgi:predicted ATP-binding protein involved in virulence
VTGVANKFASLSLGNWRQFDEVSIQFGERMTILTGANGAGKTTILNLLSRHFGWSINFIGTLSITRKGAWKYFSGAGRDLFAQEENPEQEIGELRYSNGETAKLTVAPQVSENFNVNVAGQQPVDGIYITSHRPVYAYQRVDQIPTQISANDQLFDQYISNLRQYYNPRARVESPSFRLKSALISLATFGYGNAALEPNEGARETFESFQEVLRKVLPKDLGFREIRIHLPDVILKCEESDFSLDAASGGIAALLDLAWQIHMKSLTAESFAVVLDEPENHLHPTLQRSVLGGLLDAFPQTQFVVATHNPFVVTSVADSTVVVLDFFDGKVRSSDLSEFDRAASANQVLMDVLGVPFPMPMWVEDEVERVVSSLEDSEINEATLTETKNRLSELGLGDMFPEVVDRLLDRADPD